LNGIVGGVAVAQHETRRSSHAVDRASHQHTKRIGVTMHRSLD
jgi:hypothetical protein